MKLHRASLTAMASALLLAAGIHPAASQAREPEVRTDRGTVAGVTEQGVAAFLGIPYAAAPTGMFRWRAPQPVAAWSGTRNAKAFGPSCPQTIGGDVGPWTREYLTSGRVDEDCLSLNVWTGNLKGRKPMPVLLWIHGGGFVSGSASVPVYDGAPLARDGIVVVSINYRLGLLGFFGSSEFRNTGGGNFAVQDQIAALRWVQRNIRAFGGDPRQVTIAGQSAGALSVHALMLSPQARGLFARAIPESWVGMGNDLSLGFRSRADAERGASAILDAAGVRTVDDARKLTLPQLAGAFGALAGRPDVAALARPLPYADGLTVPADTRAALAQGKYNDTPVLLGFTADEGSGLNRSYRVSDQKAYEALLRTRVGSLAPDFAKYYPTTAPSTSFPALLRDGGQVSLVNWSAARNRTSRFPLYAYLWTHVEPGPASARYGAFHTSEVPYVFETLDKAPGRNFTAVDRNIAKTMSGYWINFAKTGNPNGAGLPTWPRFHKDGDIIELGGGFGRYPAVDPGAVALFQRHLDAGGDLQVVQAPPK